MAETYVRTQVHLLSMKLATSRLRIMLQNFMSMFFKVFQNVDCTKIQMTAYYHEANWPKEMFHHYAKPHFTMWSQHEWIWINLFCYWMSHESIPCSSTGFQPFYLLHLRQINLPTTDDLILGLHYGNEEINHTCSS